MNTFNICLCILVTIIFKPSSATLSDLFGGQDSGPPPQVRQIQQLGQLAQQIQQLAPNPVQLLGQIGQYGPQLLELANQAQRFFSEDENDSQQQLPQLGRPSIPQGLGQGQGQGQGQGPRFGPPNRQQQQQQQIPLQQQQQQQQRNKQYQSPSFNLNQLSPQSEDGDVYYGPTELDSPPEVVHIHRHIIEHRGPSGFGGNGQGSQGIQNDQNVRVYKIIHESGNGLGNGYGNGYGGGYGNGGFGNGYGYKYGNGI